MQKTLSTIKSLIIVLALTIGMSYVFAAWTGPTATAPGNNAEAPINVGTTAQGKGAGLFLAGDGWSATDFCIVDPVTKAETKCLSSLTGGTTGGAGGGTLTLDANDSGPATIMQAFLSCQAAGKRLPTADELLYFALPGTAQNADTDFLWSTDAEDDQNAYTVIQLIHSDLQRGNAASSFDYSGRVDQNGTSKYRCVSGGFGGGTTVTTGGGVSKIIAGAGISVTPTAGTGDVTVSATAPAQSVGSWCGFGYKNGTTILPIGSTVSEGLPGPARGCLTDTYNPAISCPTGYIQVQTGIFGSAKFYTCIKS